MSLLISLFSKSITFCITRSAGEWVFLRSPNNLSIFRFLVLSVQRAETRKDNKNNLSLSVTRSLVAHPSVGPCSPSVRECSSLPRSSVRQIIFVPKKSIVTGSIARHSAYLTHTVSSCLKSVRRASVRSSPSLGHSALRPSWPRAPVPSFRALTHSVQGHLNRVSIALLFKSVCQFASRQISGIPSARNLSSLKARSPLFPEVSACRTWLQKAPGSLRPCRPPSPQTPHPPHTPQ